MSTSVSAPSDREQMPAVRSNGDNTDPVEPHSSVVDANELFASTGPVETRGQVALAGLGAVLLALGLVVVLFFAYLFGITNLQASRSQKLLVEQLGSAAGLAAFDGKIAHDGEAAAIVTIPAVHVHAVAVQGTTATDLEQGPGLMPETAAPGTLGVSVIAGRRSTYGGVFGSIDQLRAGDVIGVTTGRGSFHYVVTDVRRASALTVGRTSVARLLLVTSATSYPPSGLVVVSSRLVGTALPSASVSAGLPTPAELRLAGDSDALLPTFLLAALLVVGLAATIFAYRRTRLPMVIYLLSTPVLLMIAFLCFENLAKLLPSTM